jgi:DnaJ-class molecular chaperone
VTDKRVVDRSHPSSVCPACEGEGAVLAGMSIHSPLSRAEIVVCDDCDGTGEKKT